MLISKLNGCYITKKKGKTDKQFHQKKRRKKIGKLLTTGI